MSVQEKSITCFDCGVTFAFTVEEQLSYQAKGHFNAPKRCPSCREVRKTRQTKINSFKSPQPGFQLFPAINDKPFFVFTEELIIITTGNGPASLTGIMREAHTDKWRYDTEKKFCKGITK